MDSRETLIKAMKKRAERGAIINGNLETRYFHDARKVHHETGSLLIYTRDVEGDERSYHFNISFWDLERETPRAFDSDIADDFVRLFFSDHLALVWEQREIVPGIELRHYRLLCDANWKPTAVWADVMLKRGAMLWQQPKIATVTTIPGQTKSRILKLGE